jgi:GNAT superfamily N-acetyltransferase
MTELAARSTPPVTAIRKERMRDVIEEIKPLLAAHYREIAHFPDIPLDPDYTRYAEMELKGVIRIFTVRDREQLVGYAIYFVMPSLHYQGSKQAFQDILFLHPAYRKGFVGAELIRTADAELRDEGVQVVRQHVKAAHDFGKLLTHLGYEIEDHIWTKRLDR